MSKKNDFLHKEFNIIYITVLEELHTPKFSEGKTLFKSRNF